MIFYVEDDQEIKNLILFTLKASGFECKGFSSADDFFAELPNGLPDLVMLDIMLPGEDGISILKKLKSSETTKKIPVIMCTAKGGEYDKVNALELGADDYLAKPFGMMEMIARIKALLRRSNGLQESKAVLVNNGIRMDDDKHVVFVEEEAVQLTLKEYELLHLFLKRPNIVFSREQLFDHIWGMDFYNETRTVDVHVGTLRTKLGRQGNLIQTVRGVGYKMVTEYEEKNI